MIITKNYTENTGIKLSYNSYEFDTLTNSIVVPKGYEYTVSYNSGEAPETLDLSIQGTSVPDRILLHTDMNSGDTKTIVLTVNGISRRIRIDPEFIDQDVANTFPDLLLRLYLVSVGEGANLVVGIYNLGLDTVHLKVAGLTVYDQYCSGEINQTPGLIYTSLLSLYSSDVDYTTIPFYNTTFTEEDVSFSTFSLSPRESTKVNYLDLPTGEEGE